MVENTEGKENLLIMSNFLFFPQCFQKTYTADMEKPGVVWERVKTASSLEIILCRLLVDGNSGKHR